MTKPKTKLKSWRRLALVGVVALMLATQTAAAQSEASFVPNPRPHSVVVDWVEAMLLAIEMNPPAPTVTTWRMSVVTSSMYDAWAAHDREALGTATGYSLKDMAGDSSEENQAEAISHAARRALSFTYPNQTHIFDELLMELGYDIDADSAPALVGKTAADAVIEKRSDDGSNSSNAFADTTSETWPTLYQPVNSADPDAPNGINGHDFDPNAWQPLRVPTGTVTDEHGQPAVDPTDPHSYSDQRFLTPHWSGVVPFALTSGDQFRPQPPPRNGSDAQYVDALGEVGTSHEAWVSQMNEVVSLSAGLTDRQKVIAEFWADGPHTWTPPGHWVQMAIGISLRDKHTLDEDVQMYMALTGALLDAGITSWDAKRAYDFIRPVSAIRWFYAGEQIEAWGGPNRGTRMIDGATWQPYQSPTFVTPPFAEYVSGHSTYSRAAREVLRAYTGTDALYDGVTRLGRDYDGDGAEDLMGQHVASPGTLMFEEGPAEKVVLRWETMLEASDEAGISRRFGGIHFQDGDLFGRRAGARVGEQAYARAELLWDPYHVLTRRVTDLADDGEMTEKASRWLAIRISTAGRVAPRNQTAGCELLDGVTSNLRRLREKSEVSEYAADTITADISVITTPICD